MAAPGRLATTRAAVLVIVTATALTALAGCRVKNNTVNDNLVTGKKLFVAKCGSCHTLARGGTKGTVGPDLDAAFRQSLVDGLGRSEIRGIVRGQIAHPNAQGAMPANLVRGSQAEDVAAYVAYAADNPGQDTGLLATAVQAPGAGKPALETNGQLEIDADPSGQLAYVTKQAMAKRGPVTIKMKNVSGTPHNIAVQTGTSGPVLGASPVVSNGQAQLHATLKPGTYTFFCQVDAHRAAGMLGTLVVK
jgi:mono/diheme cytochrome c family protein